MKEYFVYILRCSDGSLYTGITNEYQKRFAEHAEGIDSSRYTFSRRPLKLVYVATFREVVDAIAFEKQVKGWSRKKKEALIMQNQGLLQKFAECKNETRANNFPLKSIACHGERRRTRHAMWRLLCLPRRSLS